MRGVLLSLALAFVLAGAVPATSSASVTSSAAAISAVAPVYALHQVPDKTVTVDINVNRDGRGWYRSPVWIAIGALAVIVILLLIVIAARGGGGTTIVKD